MMMVGTLYHMFFITVVGMIPKIPTFRDVVLTYIFKNGRGGYLHGDIDTFILSSFNSSGNTTGF